MVWTSQKQQILRRGGKNTQENHDDELVFMDSGYDGKRYGCFPTVFKKEMSLITWPHPISRPRWRHLLFFRTPHCLH